MRILTVANHLGARGGLERTQLTNCDALAARGHRVDLLYVTAGDFAEDWSRFVSSMRRIGGSLPRRRHPFSSSRSVLTAVRQGRRLAPDVVYVYRYWDIPFAVVVGALTRAPVVFHLCLPPPRRVPVWLRACLRRVDTTLAVSRDTARRWDGTGLSRRCTSVVLTGIDLDHYAPASDESRSATRHDLGLRAEDFLVLYAGRIGREKGVDVLLRAFARVAAQLPRCHLVVVGSPSLGADRDDSERYQRELRELARGLPVSWLPGRHGDVLTLIQTADVAVAASLWPEPLSRSVMEPLACGVPVVASAVGGNPEILTGWLSVYLVQPDDPEALAHRIASLHAWRESDPDLGARCRREAVTRMSLEAEVDAVEVSLMAATRHAPLRRWRTISAKDATSCG